MANAIVSYKDKYDRARNALRNFKEASKAPMKAVLVSGGGVVGGVLAGAINAKMPTVGPVPVTPVVGGILCLGSWVNAEEDWSHPLNTLGSTMVGVWLAGETYAAIKAPAH